MLLVPSVKFALHKKNNADLFFVPKFQKHAEKKEKYYWYVCSGKSRFDRLIKNLWPDRAHWLRIPFTTLHSIEMNSVYFMLVRTVKTTRRIINP